MENSTNRFDHVRHGLAFGNVRRFGGHRLFHGDVLGHGTLIILRVAQRIDNTT
jgi:hypothetical protein